MTTENAYFWTNGNGDFVQVCAELTVHTVGRCLRPWGHKGPHCNQYGIEWTTETIETTEKGTQL